MLSTFSLSKLGSVQAYHDNNQDYIGTGWSVSGNNTVLYIYAVNSTVGITLQQGNFTSAMSLYRENVTYGGQNTTQFRYIGTELLSNETAYITFQPTNNTYAICGGTFIANFTNSNENSNSNANNNTNANNNNNTNNNSVVIIFQEVGNFLATNQWWFYSIGIVLLAVLVVVGIVQLAADKHDSSKRRY